MGLKQMVFGGCLVRCDGGLLGGGGWTQLG